LKHSKIVAWCRKLVCACDSDLALQKEKKKARYFVSLAGCEESWFSGLCICSECLKWLILNVRRWELIHSWNTFLSSIYKCALRNLQRKDDENAICCEEHASHRNKFHSYLFLEDGASSAFGPHVT